MQNSAFQSFKQSIVQTNSINAIDPEAVWQKNKINGYCIIRGLLDHEEINTRIDHLRSTFCPSKDQAHANTNMSKMRKNSQKLMICGGINRNALLARKFYSQINTPDTWGFCKILHQLMRTRNKILGFEENFCVDRDSKTCWVLPQIIQYPSGAGFMVTHSDSNTTERTLKYINAKYNLRFIACFTKKGVDFNSGGAYVYDNKGLFIPIDNYTEVGDIITYPTTTMHGVDLIDPNSLPKINQPGGRFVGMAPFLLNAEIYQSSKKN